VLVLAGGLSACGDSDSDNDRGSVYFDGARAIALTKADEPEETVAKQAARAEDISDRSDGLRVSTAYGETTNPALPRFTFEPVCAGSRCTIAEPRTGVRVTYDIAHPEDLENSVDASRAVLTKNDITLLEGRGGTGGEDYRIYGAWMEHGAFGVQTNISGEVGGVAYTGRIATVTGDLTGTRPEANATWRGVMVGTPTRGFRRDNILQGDAELTFDAADNQIDATFDNIVDLDRRVPHSVREIRFENVPVDVDGTYQAEKIGERIDGVFGGPEHAETAGVFEKADIVGAYGAKKQP